jgi:4-hydroxythreonine-4-phosphate dehydrogenase
MGDPAGIGPEIVAKALQNPRIFSLCHIIIFGNLQLLQKVSPNKLQEQNIADFIDIKTSVRIRPGKPGAASGKAALAYLDRAIESALHRKIDAIVTAPLSKAAVQMAGVKNFTGHTEYLAKKTNSQSVAMMFYSRRMLVSLVTTHLPLRLVASSITREKILDVIMLTAGAAKKLSTANPRIGVAGLNPHAGEQGTLGKEDQEIITPAIKAALKQGVQAEGPIPADVLFRKAYRGDFQVVIAMYHDQALAPFKMISFEQGVNVTLGLPFVRTSVDHGTAFDIAGKGIASEKSLVEAVKLAARLAR